MKKVKPRPLYVRRQVRNADAIVAWAKGQGLETAITPDEMHVTLAYSKEPVDWMKMGEATEDEVRVPAGGPRIVDYLGDKGALVLHFASYPLARRHLEMKEAGASWDYEGYQPHITLTYKAPEGFKPEEMEPYRGPILFGPEVFEEIKDFKPNEKRTDKRVIPVDVFKVDEDLGLVFGWAIVCQMNGEDYYDLHEDHIPEASMLKAAAEFMSNVRVAGDMHQRSYNERQEEDGTVVMESTAVKAGEIIFAWPMTSDIAKAMGIVTSQTGLMVAMKPDSKDILDKYRSGEYTGFSIGGTRLVDEEIEEDD